MIRGFQYDVVLHHNTKDLAVARTGAERLRRDALRLWFDKWEIKPSDSIPTNAFASNWAQLETGTFQFRNSLTKERRFAPLRLDDDAINSWNLHG